jgi:single-stranded DNA-binding protein
MIEVHISGRLTAAPETRTSRAGKPYVMARLACPNGSDRDGKERSDYITLFAYGEAAEKLTGAAQNRQRNWAAGSIGLAALQRRRTTARPKGSNVANHAAGSTQAAQCRRGRGERPTAPAKRPTQ